MNNKLASFCGTIDMFHDKWMYVININALNNPRLDYLLNVESLIFRYIEFSFDDGDVEKFTDYNVRRWNIAHEKILGGFTSQIFRAEEIRNVGETAISCFLDENDELIDRTSNFHLSNASLCQVIKELRKHKEFLYRNDLEKLKTAQFKRSGV